LLEIYGNCTTKERPSLFKVNQVFKNYGHVNISIVEGYSSGENTDVEEKETEASINEVVEKLTDLNQIMVCKNVEDFPREARASLIFTNIEEWFNIHYMKIFIEETPCFT